MNVQWGRYQEAFKAIHDAIRSGLASAPEGKTITEINFTYDSDGDIVLIIFKENTEVLFTLAFGYDGSKNLTSITRS